MKWCADVGAEDYERILSRFNQVYRDANEPEGVALFGSVDIHGHMDVLGLNAAAEEHCPQLFEEFSWSECPPSIPFKWSWIAGDKQLNKEPKRPY